MAWVGVRLMALKFLSASGGGRTSDAIKCLNYAPRPGFGLAFYGDFFATEHDVGWTHDDFWMKFHGDLMILNELRTSGDASVAVFSI